MKKLLLANAVLVALAATSAMAADMPVKYKAPPPPFGWTGCYGGINMGWTGSQDRYDLSMGGGFLAPGNLFANPANNGQFVASYKPLNSAFNGGVQAGCNYQFGVAVFGVEADFNETSLRETALASYGPIGPFVGGGPGLASSHDEQATKNLVWYSTFRARLGYAGDRVLYYVTGGAAVGKINSSTTVSFQADQVFLNGDIFHGETSVTKAGWTAGAGIEWPVEVGWTVKLEYMYLDLGSFSYASGCVAPAACGGGAPPFAWQTNIRVKENLFRAGINYRFGGGPLIAKY
jgi:outer membrane immunogenic protein